MAARGRLYTARMTASICRSQIVNWFQLALFWATNIINDGYATGTCSPTAVGGSVADLSALEDRVDVRTRDANVCVHHGIGKRAIARSSSVCLR